MVAGALTAGAESLPDRIQFNRDVRPIFSNTCFHCHGPDPKTREAGLRLDIREEAIAERKNGAAIVPGNPMAGDAFRRILSTDPGEQMPPPDSHLSLTKRQIAIVKKWIEQGAEYQKHWAFVPPVRPETPKQSWWRKKHTNPIDAFVGQRLKEERLRFSPEADRETLIRRVTLDLLGLPPTPEEVDDFLADDREDAYERLVDRLLASPHYGERMTLDWLDAARFGDTQGYQIDLERDMTLWREWVIDAYNRNLPFDQFTIEQLAGDLLPDATIEHKIASGFNRNAMINGEGGIIKEEYRYAYAVDRVNTTGTVWMGLTLSCAQCHDHKFDPLPTREFHQLVAFFESVQETISQLRGNAAPVLKAPRLPERQQLTKLEAELAEVEAELEKRQPRIAKAQAEWEEGLASDGGWQTLSVESAKSAGGATLTLQEDRSLLASGANPARDTYVVTGTTALGRVTGLRVEALPDPSLPSNGPGRAGKGNIVLTDLQLRVEVDGKAGEPLAIASATADFTQPEWPPSRLAQGDKSGAWALHPQLGKPHVLTVAFAEPADLPSGAKLQITLAFNSRFGQHQLGRFRLAATDLSSGRVHDAVPRHLIAQQSEDGDRATLDSRLREHFLAFVHRDLLVDRIHALNREIEAINAAAVSTMIMQDLPKPRQGFVRMRGQYDAKGEEVEPGVPSVLGSMPPDAPKNRLGLAQWLASRDNPLTARVTVNRHWQRYFGAGLVNTPDDFGSQGAWPSHPELLDWLAVEFMESGWNLKALQKLIVTSATYRQGSRISAEALERDPKNVLLGRGPRLRLPAETIRDQALAVSGLLNREIGGKSVTVYQPPTLWEELGFRSDGAYQRFKRSDGEDLYRRSLYVYAKRTAPLPFLSTFDAPDRQVCSVSRQRTNTPLQALNLMNDVAFVEAARKFAERILREGGSSFHDRATFAFQTLLARPGTTAEHNILRTLINNERATYADSPEKMQDLLSFGESPADTSLNPLELTLWTIAANTLLNLDETITKK